MRVILDTNLWSSIGDEMVTQKFDDLMKSHSLQVLVPPSTLVEVVRIPVAEARRRIVHALAKGPRRRLRTEAESESVDLISEIKRTRPQWLRTMPDTARVASLNGFWTKRIWREAIQDSTRLHEYQVSRTGKYDYLVARQKEQRHIFLRDNADLRPLAALIAQMPPEVSGDYMPGWSGEAVEPWRILFRDVYWHELVEVAGRAPVTKEDTTFADWVGAYVDMARLRSNPADFTRLWLEDVCLQALPRHWVRWAVNILQANHKVTQGNPADEQHSSYLVECDLFLSADARYVSILEAVRADAPFSLAESRLVSGDRSAPIIDRLASIL
jgi:hypothetical protein